MAFITANTGDNIICVAIEYFLIVVVVADKTSRHSEQITHIISEVALAFIGILEASVWRNQNIDTGFF